MGIKDSGSKQEFSTGAHRDNPVGKGRCDLLPLSEVACLMEDSVLSLISHFYNSAEVNYLYKALEYGIKNNLGDDTNIDGVSLSTDTSKYACAMLEVSKLYEEGALKYGENNWKLGMPVTRYLDSGIRHYLKVLRGDTDENHFRSFIWNILCAIWTQDNLEDMAYKVPTRSDNQNCPSN